MSMLRYRISTSEWVIDQILALLTDNQHPLDSQRNDRERIAV